MKISELETALAHVREKYGDLDVWLWTPDDYLGNIVMNPVDKVNISKQEGRDKDTVLYVVGGEDY